MHSTVGEPIKGKPNAFERHQYFTLNGIGRFNRPGV